MHEPGLGTESKSEVVIKFILGTIREIWIVIVFRDNNSIMIM